MNRRTYDIAACGGFQLADHKQDIDTVFSQGSEMICYRTIEELKELIVYYLAHPRERAAVAEAARKRVLMDHTYDVRAREILERATRS